MKRKEKMFINLGEEFELIGDIKKSDIDKKEFKSCYECYERPSDTKKDIYNRYSYMLDNYSDIVLQYGINSYNVYNITLHAVILYKNEMYYCYITKTKNVIARIIEG